MKREIIDFEDLQERFPREIKDFKIHNFDNGIVVILVFDSNSTTGSIFDIAQDWGRELVEYFLRIKKYVLIPVELQPGYGEFFVVRNGIHLARLHINDDGEQLRLDLSISVRDIFEIYYMLEEIASILEDKLGG